MSDTTRERFISVIVRNLKAGAKRARTLGATLALTIFRVIRHIVSPSSNTWVNRLDTYAFEKHPVVHTISSLLTGPVALFVKPVQVALVAVAKVAAPALVAWAGTSALGYVTTLALAFIALSWISYVASLTVTWGAVSLAHGLKVGAKVLSDAVSLLAAGLTGAITVFALGISLVLTGLGTGLNYGITFLHKIVWGLTLVLQTPGLALAGGDALATDWGAYRSSWSPKRFHCNTLSDVIMQEAREQHAIVLNFPVDGKGQPTPKQVKRHKTLGPVNQMVESL